MDDPDAPVTEDERRHQLRLINRLVGRYEDAGPLPDRPTPTRGGDELPPRPGERSSTRP